MVGGGWWDVGRRVGRGRGCNGRWEVGVGGAPGVFSEVSVVKAF